MISRILLIVFSVSSFLEISFAKTVLDKARPDQSTITNFIIYIIIAILIYIIIYNWRAIVEKIKYLLSNML